MLDYRFDDSVIQLNEFLRNNTSAANILIILIWIYYFIVCLAPALLTIGPYGDTREGLKDSCTSGIAYESHIIYAVFALISLIFEFYLYSQALKRIGHLLP